MSDLMKGSSLLVLAVTVGVMAAGCDHSSQTKNQAANKAPVVHTLRILVVDDSNLAQAIKRQWQANSEQPIHISELSAERLSSVRHLAADVVIYPSEQLGVLAERKLIQPLKEKTLNEPQLAIRDVFELERREEVRWGEQVYAVSFGSPQLVLFYRKDIFQQLKLKPPTTWKEYEMVAQRLQQWAASHPAKADFPNGAVLEPMDGVWSAKLLLARAAAYARHPSQFSTMFDYITMEPLIAGPPFERALKELVAVCRLRPKRASLLTPEQIKEQFLAGHAAMAMSWPTHAAAARSNAGNSAKGITLQFGIAALPGATEAYDFGEDTWTQRKEDEPLSIPLLAVAGRLGSVTEEAIYPREAGEALTWLAGKKWSPLVSPSSPATTLFRRSHLAKPALWTDPGFPPEASREYVEVVADTQSRPDHMASLRIPGAQQYLAVLSKAVRAACRGAEEPAAVLKEVDKQWRKITEQLGRDAQRDAYTRSLGLEP